MKKSQNQSFTHKLLIIVGQLILFLVLLIASVMVVSYLLENVLLINISQSVLWFPVIMLCGPGLIITILLTWDFYRGSKFTKERSCSNISTGTPWSALSSIIGSIYDIFSKLLGDPQLKRPKNNFVLALFYGILFSLISTGVIILVVLIANLVI